jgi:seryl-tRNA synthetase
VSGAVRAGTPAQRAFRDELVAAGLLIPSGVDGLYGRGAAFERIRLGLEAHIERAAAVDDAERPRFPPLYPRADLERVDYLRSFPHLAGAIFAFDGDEPAAHALQEAGDRHEGWAPHVEQTDLVLTPAACYPVYPAVAARGPLPPGGVTVDLGGSYVFRREPAEDPARLQVFHQHEMVRLAEPEVVQAWRDGWRDRAVALLRDLGLDAQPVAATDPFFGRAGRMLARNQRVQELKFEVQVPLAGDEPTAVASFNYHQDHFASAFGLVTADGAVAHTACLGFGHERIVLALLRAHGLGSEKWPSEVRAPLAV